MKKWLLTAAMVALLSACSASNESKQQAGDNYQKSNPELPFFAPLASGGVNLPTQSVEYQLPQVKIAKTENVDIRPPSIPLAIINGSITQFDGERALIVYESNKKQVYNVKQIERLLKEQEIGYHLEGKKLVTDWTETGRVDDLKNTQIRYQIEEVNARQANALMVSVLQMKRDGTVFTPSLADKQRYASDRLNQFVGELNSTYQKQQQELRGVQSSPIQSAIATDSNGRIALVLNAPFEKALSQEEWLRIGTQLPELEKGDYQMQLAAAGKQSAVVISDEKKTALSGKQAQIIYQALQNVLAK